MALLLLVSAGCSSSRPPKTGAVDVGIHYSRFTPAAITVEAGTSVTFTVRNGDPIAHEFVVGTLAEQQAHERGTEATHDGAPGAASLEPGEAQAVSFDFGKRGTYEYACHLPDHYSYGMRGTVTVT